MLVAEQLGAGQSVVVRELGADLVAVAAVGERGEQQPGKVLANLKTAGLPEVLRELIDSGWTPSVPAG